MSFEVNKWNIPICGSCLCCRERERELPEFFRVTVEQRGVEFTTVAILERLLSGKRMEWKSLEACESAFQFSNVVKEQGKTLSSNKM